MIDLLSRQKWTVVFSALFLLIVASGCNADEAAAVPPPPPPPAAAAASAATAAQDDFSSIRSSRLDLATWIKQGFEEREEQVTETKESRVCLGSNLLHILLQLIAQKDAEVNLRQLTDEQLQVLCSILCGLGICPPGCPENSNPCPWGCGPDR